MKADAVTWANAEIPLAMHVVVGRSQQGCAECHDESRGFHSLRQSSLLSMMRDKHHFIRCTVGWKYRGNILRGRVKGEG